MEKILFYGNEWADFKEFVTVFEALQQEGFEVAVTTHNKDLLLPLSVGKLLVVASDTYYEDVLVYMDGKQPLNKKALMKWSELLELVKK